MALFPQDALNPGVRKREVFGWAMYDFANSGYTTVVLTAVFNAYFVGVVAGNAPWATLAWTAVVALSSAIVMVTMPAIGAYADLHASKKRLLAISTAGCVLATATLAWIGPGDVYWAAAAIVVSNAFYVFGESLTASFLPELSRREAIGRVSGWGWSFGYCGGMLTLGLSLGYAMWAQGQGRPATEFVPVTILITAAVYALASLATFALLRERAVPQPNGPSSSGIAPALRRLQRTWHCARHYADFRWLLACGASYQAGIAVVIALAAVYAEQVMGFRQTQTMTLIFVVNIASAAGAFAFGYAQDRIGHKLALGATLVAGVVMTLMAAAATTPGVFWAAALIAGLCMGSSLSAGRALAGLFAPRHQLAEFFALWTAAARVAAIIGPLSYGLVNLLTGGNHRLALLPSALFFALGVLFLLPVVVERGMAASRSAVQQTARRPPVKSARSSSHGPGRQE